MCRKDGRESRELHFIMQPAAGAITEVHHRMPLFVAPSAFDAWLDTQTSANDALAEVAKYHGESNLVLQPVSMRVNSPANEDAAVQGPPEENVQRGLW
jgi:putative SOS response-associated peptidase YedK